MQKYARTIARRYHGGTPSIFILFQSNDNDVDGRVWSSSKEKENMYTFDGYTVCTPCGIATRERAPGTSVSNTLEVLTQTNGASKFKEIVCWLCAAEETQPLFFRTAVQSGITKLEIKALTALYVLRRSSSSSLYCIFCI